MKIRRIDYSPDEFLAGTVMLSDAECGLYWRACSLIYSVGGPIKKDLLRAASRSHGNTFNANLKRLLDLGKLISNGDEIDQKRARKEIENAEKRSRIGAENVGKRWKNKEVDNTTVLPCANTNHQPSTINHQPVEGKPTSAWTLRDDGELDDSGFSGKAIKLSTESLAECRKVYPHVDLNSRLVVYDAKFVSKAEFPTLSKILAWLTQDAAEPLMRAPRSSPPAGANGYDRELDTRTEAQRERDVNVITFVKYGRWKTEWGDKPTDKEIEAARRKSTPIRPVVADDDPLRPAVDLG